MAMKSDCCDLGNNGKGVGGANLKKRLSSPQLRQQIVRTKFHKHPDHSIHIIKLNRLIGQLEGVRRMIEERRYCPDILIQSRAAASALKNVELAIFETHLRHCVSEALNSPDGRKAAMKVEELVKVVGRF